MVIPILPLPPLLMIPLLLITKAHCMILPKRAHIHECQKKKEAHSNSIYIYAAPFENLERTPCNLPL
jgi:hypothetical protein